MGSIDEDLADLRQAMQDHPDAERDGAYVPTQDEFGYEIREQPFGTKRKMRYDEKIDHLSMTVR